MSSFDTYKYIFDKTYIKERKQNKDICDFSLEEIEQFFRDCKYPVYSLRTYKNILRQYIDFAIDQKWTDRDSNPLVHSNSSWEREVAVNPPYYSDSDIQEILSRCVNAQDKVVIQLLFYELVGGDQCSEITNLRESDIDRKNNRLFLRDKHNTERYTYVSGETMTLLEEAIAQIEFINDNGNEHLKYKSQPLLENGYVLKPTPKGRKRDTLQPAYSLIHQRLKTLQTNLELKNFTYKKLFQAGMVFYAKKVYEEIGKVDIQKAIDVIYEKRGLKKTIAKNQYGLVYESIPSHHRQYVREEVVRRGYDLQLGNPVEDFVIDRVINVKENPKTTVEIKNRGVEQRIFKIELLDAYERKCAISGETTIQVLEACHIHPYQNLLSNHVQNGLLLRIDLHRLFDKGLIMIDDQYIVRIHPNLESIPTKRLTG